MTRIGIDFDNTLVCYDEIFHRLAVAHGYAAGTIPKSKQAVRDRMRANGQEQQWRELQGEVYGRRMPEAEAFPDALEFIRRCDESGVEYAIISHKTVRPAAGPAHDLHAAATSWLERHAIAGAGQIGAYFELTRREKLERIRTLACDYFIDDLPEFLTSEEFPEGVERLLFDPTDSGADDPRYRRFRSWAEIAAYIFNAVDRRTDSQVTRAEQWASRLLETAGRGAPLKVEPISGGANNRVFGVETSSERFVLKKYFRASADDTRDRLDTEYRFTGFAAELGITCLHHPVVMDRALNAALYTFADGETFVGKVPGQSHVDQAMDFFDALNRDGSAARDLPLASEACFSVASHISTIDQRLHTLEELVSDRQARSFIVSVLVPAWSRIAAGARRAAGTRIFEEIGMRDRCLSPSDFGFHNAVLGGDGRVTFLDFEYAGWDDPARMVCDFFSQVSVPVPISFLPRVAARVATIVDDERWFRERLDLLMPVYRIKWCGILLNDFLPSGKNRREFAGKPRSNTGDTAQLEKARAMLSSLDAAVDAKATG